MKKMYIHVLRRFSLFALLLFLTSISAIAQRVIVGIVSDEENNEPLIGATVKAVGSSEAAVTDIDGKYSISVKNTITALEISYVGYDTKQVPVAAANVINITLGAGKILEEVVVVGYGSKKKKDLTGAVSSVSSKDFNPGNLTTPEQLVSGKIAGVQITSNGGAPGAGSRIRIRGGTSLNASNDPLIVIDGVPVDNGGIAGSPNPLSLINPNDIENVTVLKDASAAAIYGARGANGVMIITTKKGATGGKLNIELNSVNSLSNLTNYVDTYSADEFRNLINTSGTEQQKNLLGDASTNWQEEIYRNAMSTDNNLTFSGGVKKLPYRLNIGYLNQNGVLLRSNMNRYSAGLSINPSFFDDQLKLNLNAKFNRTKSFFADQGAIGSAVTFDPTQSTTSDTTLYGGYFEWLDNVKRPIVLAPRNPLGLLYQKDDIGFANRFLGNFSADYTIKQLPGVRLNVNVGTDRVTSNGTVFIPETAASTFTRKGTNNSYEFEKYNNLLETFAHYTKELGKNKIDASLGHTYQKWHSMSPNLPDINAVGDTVNEAAPFPFETENLLISFVGRLNYTFNEKYLLTATLRNDHSSRFSPNTRSGWFPSAAFAWRIASEDFLKDNQTVSDLKLRLGWGVTGQQDIFNDYPYIPNYYQGNFTAQVQFGNQFVSVLRPDAYDPNIKWEETTTYNAGLDYGFFDGRLNGSFDVYQKNTKDLLASIPVPAGTNFSDKVLTNVGSIENKGFEIVINGKAIATRKTNLEFGFNYSLNQNKITKLNTIDKDNDVGILTGGISGGVGNNIQVNTVGYSINTFYVYEQKIGEDGKPIQGANLLESFVDRNEDGVINSDDRYRYKQSEPQSFLGFNSNFSHGNLFGGFVMRASLGNFMYNNVASNLGYFAASNGSKKFLTNIHSSFDDTGFVKDPTAEQFLSDYYITDASFLRMDNASIGYNLSNLLNNKIKLSASFIVQNVFVLSKYEGLDPEIAGGIDNNIYPRPRTYSVALNFQF